MILYFQEIFLINPERKKFGKIFFLFYLSRLIFRDIFVIKQKIETQERLEKLSFHKYSLYLFFYLF